MTQIQIEIQNRSVDKSWQGTDPRFLTLVIQDQCQRWMHGTSKWIGVCGTALLTRNLLLFYFQGRSALFPSWWCSHFIFIPFISLQPNWGYKGRIVCPLGLNQYSLMLSADREHNNTGLHLLNIEQQKLTLQIDATNIFFCFLFFGFLFSSTKHHSPVLFLNW